MGLLKQTTIDTQTALDLVLAAREYATAHDLKVAIAVVDRAGHLCAFAKVDGAPTPCSKIAEDKAYTAVSFGARSRQLAENLLHENQRVMASLVGYDRLALFGGGVPVVVNSEVVGAVGVSGASEREDEDCAMAAVKEIGDRK